MKPQCRTSCTACAPASWLDVKLAACRWKTPRHFSLIVIASVCHAASYWRVLYMHWLREGLLQLERLPTSS